MNNISNYLKEYLEKEKQCLMQKGKSLMQKELELTELWNKNSKNFTQEDWKYLLDNTTNINAKIYYSNQIK